MTYFFRKPFAESGDITQIPQTPKGDGTVSYQEGWPENYELDIQKDPEEARNLSRTNFNGLFFNITSALQELQKMGANPYITASDNGGEPYGYPLGGCCGYTDPDTGDYGVYYSLVGDNTTLPSEKGVTGKYWQRIFDKKVDSLKSNRISDSVLYYAEVPSFLIDETTSKVRITIHKGTRCLFANGLNADGSFNNKIIQTLNDCPLEYELTENTSTYFIFLTSDEKVLYMTSEKYSTYFKEESVIVEKGETSTTDVYYFDEEKNKWRIRLAGEKEFKDLDVSLIQIARFTGDTKGNNSLSYVDPLKLIDSDTFDAKMSMKQQTLIPTKRVTLTSVQNEGQIINVKIPTEATPFCVNAGNMNSSGDLDLCVTKSIVLNDVRQAEINDARVRTIRTWFTGNPYTQPRIVGIGLRGGGRRSR